MNANNKSAVSAIRAAIAARIAADTEIVSRADAKYCPLCGVRAVVALTASQLTKQPDNTTHVCHPGFRGCNVGFGQ